MELKTSCKAGLLYISIQIWRKNKKNPKKIQKKSDSRKNNCKNRVRVSFDAAFSSPYRPAAPVRPAAKRPVTAAQARLRNRVKKRIMKRSVPETGTRIRGPVDIPVSGGGPPDAGRRHSTISASTNSSPSESRNSRLMRRHSKASAIRKIP